LIPDEKSSVQRPENAYSNFAKTTHRSPFLLLFNILNTLSSEQKNTPFPSRFWMLASTPQKKFAWRTDRCWSITHNPVLSSIFQQTNVHQL